MPDHHVSALALGFLAHASALLAQSPARTAAPEFATDYQALHAAMLASTPESLFFPDGERLCVLSGTPGAARVDVVDLAGGPPRPLLDAARTRAALTAAGVADLPAGRGLPFARFDWVDGTEDRILVEVGGRPFVLDLADYTATPAQDVAAAVARRTPRPVRPGLFLHSPPIMEVGSPDGHHFATIDDEDLWLRRVTDDGMVRLSEDGRPEHGYELDGALWAPDGRRLAVLKFDRRAVPRLTLPRWTGPRESIETRHYSAAGEPIPRPSLHLFDVETGANVEAVLGEQPYIHPAAWAPDGRTLYVLRMSRLMDRLDVLAVDPSTGAARPVIRETSTTFLHGLPFLHGYADRLASMRLLVPLADGRRLLWTSEREGLRRIYLCSDDGEMLAASTPAGLHVDRVLRVDDAEGVVWFTASDPASERPYAHHVYRAPLTGGEAELLFELPSLANLDFTRSGRFLLVLRAGLEQPLTLELRRADGTLVRSLWTADMRPFEELGWRPPERFTATAADGETPLHGVLILPTDFDPSRRYPVIEHIYAGPHTIHTPQAVWNRFVWTGQAMADRGYVVLMVDGRGTPGRGKAFQDVVHGRLGQFEIDDHAAVLHELAASRPYMDLDRTGIWGHSWGGYFALRALLTRPDVYHVGVAVAPAVDLVNFRVSVEPYVGCLPADCPDVYAAGANTTLAGQLEGKLLLVHGTRDDDVPFAETMRMVDALIDAGKHFDLLVFPDATHVSFLGPYFQEALLRHFDEHLGR